MLSNSVFRVALLVGLLLRVALIVETRSLGTAIVDEQQYSQLAENVVQGSGFGWAPGNPTSIRPPLYPLLLAGIWKVTGLRNLIAVRVIQVAVMMFATALLYRLALLAYGIAVARWATVLFWLAPSFIFFNLLILTETLFTFLVIAFTLLSVMLISSPRGKTALLCGLSLGLAALTRSVLWPLPLLFCPLLMVVVKGAPKTRLLMALFVLVGYAIVVTPWAIRNTRLQGVVEVVDTMGGLNMRMGNYEYTPDERMWAAVDILGEQNWAYGLARDFPGHRPTEGEKDKWAQAKALEYMRRHPAQTMRRSLIKFADFWGLEREFVAGVKSGMYSPPWWFVAFAASAILLCYPVVAILGGLGVWMARPDSWKTHLFLLLPGLFILFGHVLAFGHSRYHLPLMPVLSVYAGAFVVRWRTGGLRRWRSIAGVAAAITVLVFVAIWTREIAIVDAERIKMLLSR